MGSDETKGKRPSEVDDEEEDPPEEPASPATPQPDVVAPVIEALKPVVSRFNYAARAFEQLLGPAAEKHDQPEPTDKPTGPAKPGTAPADANAAANAAALKKLDDSFETSLRTRTEAFENLKVSDQPGSAAETSLLDIEWQKQIIETLGRFGKEQSKLDLTVKPVDLQAALIVGLIISIFQAATQINESTLSFIPRLVAMFITLIFAGPWMLQLMIDYIRRLFESIPSLIG